MTATPSPVPDLTVVVAVHDVEGWIEECLESVAACVPEGTEVVVVDDGSTDRSGELCDQAAAGRLTWTVIHQPNAGLGAARNVGMDRARGRWVGFVDGDDVLLPGYAELARRAAGTGADVVTGSVLRTDGTRSWPSGLHARALDPLGGTANLLDDASLVYDTTAWNKLYRRDFLRGHGLRFPEGVLYEDLPVTVRALRLAGDVPVVHEPVYSWRERQGTRSITQRRNELSNLVDRFAAVRDVDRFLETEGLATVRERHDVKVLTLDLPLYTAALPEADDEYRAAYLSFFDHLVAGLPPERRVGLPPTLRLYVELAERGRLEDLVAVVRARRGPRPWVTDERGRLRRVRDNLASFAIERSLGLDSDLALARRMVTSTSRLLLPDRARRRPVGWRSRRPAGGVPVP